MNKAIYYWDFYNESEVRHHKAWKTIREWKCSASVIPAKAGIQFPGYHFLDSRLRGNDKRRSLLSIFISYWFLKLMNIASTELFRILSIKTLWIIPDKPEKVKVHTWVHLYGDWFNYSGCGLLWLILSFLPRSYRDEVPLGQGRCRLSAGSSPR